MSWIEILFFIFVGVLAWHYSVLYYNTRKNFPYLKKFSYVPLLHAYKETEQKIYLGEKKAPRAVLLLHGFSSSVKDFGSLFERLKEAKIPYFAPSITGFGLSDFHLLKVVQPSDWLRDAFYAYDLLAAAAEKVDVIGFSNGGCLAAILAQNRPVGKLILASPYLAPNPRDRLFYTLFRTPVFNRIVPFLIPLGKKPKLAGRSSTLDALDPKASEGYFHDPYVTSQSVLALWELQSQVHFSNKLLTNEVFGLFGSHDILIDLPKTKEIFLKNRPDHKLIEYPNSAHILFHDYAREQAIGDVMKILQSDS